jgi:hypothetical protein
LKYHLIFTLDYELFGNGSGCIDKCLIDPTDRCASLLEKVNAPLTLFVETLELAEFSGTRSTPIQAQYPSIAAQLTKLQQNGHKLELHLHPQWMTALQNGNDWSLAFDKWRIGDLDTNEIAACIEQGLEYLAPFLNQANANSSIFRAGGWAMQPSKKVLQGLSKAGFTIDSTVAPGAFNPSKGDWFDFRKTPNLPYWSISDDICTETLTGKMIEVPIATQQIGLRAHSQALKEHKSEAQFPASCSGSYAGPNTAFQTFRGKLAKIANLGTVMLDFSTLPAWAMIEVTERYMDRFKDFDGTIPIVAIGHNKNFSARSEESLLHYLDWASNYTEITFSSYDRWLKTI